MDTDRSDKDLGKCNQINTTLSKNNQYFIGSHVDDYTALFFGDQVFKGFCCYDHWNYHWNIFFDLCCNTYCQLILPKFKIHDKKETVTYKTSSESLSLKLLKAIWPRVKMALCFINTILLFSKHSIILVFI